MTEAYARTDLAMESCSAAGDGLRGVEQTTRHCVGCCIHRRERLRICWRESCAA